MAQLQFPDPNTTNSYTEAGITWTWNATLGVWSTDPNDGFTETIADSRYLRLDSAAGSQTVESTSQLTLSGLTTHEGGVSVTGGTLGVGNGMYYRIADEGSLNLTSDGDWFLRKNNDSGTIIRASKTNSSTPSRQNAGFVLNVGGTVNHFIEARENDNKCASLVVSPNFSNGDINLPTFGYSLVRASLNGAITAGSNVAHLRAFEAQNRVAEFGCNLNYGFYSAIDNDVNGVKTNYNFYAAGTAPNYFAGPVLVGGNALGVYGANEFMSDSGKNGIRGFAKSSVPANDTPIEIKSVWRGDASANWAILFSGSTSDSDATAVVRGAIRISDTGVQYSVDAAGTPAFVEYGDHRNQTYTSFNGSASTLIQALNPKVNGFIPHELQATVPSAVVGTQDETEAIGTYTDVDGNVETDVAEPSVIPAGASFVATGERDVYQGVDQTKLIPLLTKALQEALERIEVLEAAAGGN